MHEYFIFHFISGLKKIRTTKLRYKTLYIVSKDYIIDSVIMHTNVDIVIVFLRYINPHLLEI